MNDDLDSQASNELWERVKSIYILSLKSDDEKAHAERYLGMVNSVKCEGLNFTIFTSSAYAADLIKNGYLNKLKEIFILAGANSDLNIDIQYDLSAKQKIQPLRVSSPSHNEIQIEKNNSFISPLPLNEDYTFEEFVSGPSNSFAIAAAKAVVENPGKIGYNPLFIHGGTGLGKTHLMHAIGNELKKRNPSLAVCYLTAEVYMNEYINSMISKVPHEFQKKYRSIDVLLIDDIQFLKKGGATQEEFFNNFNTLRDAKKQIVITSDVAPKNLPSTIEERLVSRFEGGMLQEIETPNYETRLAILKKKNENSDIKIPDNALEYIADNIKSHVRAMEGALAKLEVFISANPGTLIEKQLLSSILDDFIKKEISRRKLTIEEIQQACAKKYGVTIADILSHERTQNIVTPRQMAMYIAKKCTSKGLKEIGDAFGKKHATIINGVKTISQRLINESDLKLELEEILSLFGYKITDIIE